MEVAQAKAIMRAISGYPEQARNETEVQSTQVQSTQVSCHGRKIRRTERAVGFRAEIVHSDEVMSSCPQTYEEAISSSD